jgi:hypothetical protein
MVSDESATRLLLIWLLILQVWSLLTFYAAEKAAVIEHLLKSNVSANDILYLLFNTIFIEKTICYNIDFKLHSIQSDYVILDRNVLNHYKEFPLLSHINWLYFLL